jgi:hypothetical protein
MANRSKETKNYFPQQTSLLRQPETPAANCTYKKLAFQWLNQHLCFVSSSIPADSFVLRNRQLLVGVKR